MLKGLRIQSKNIILNRNIIKKFSTVNNAISITPQQEEQQSIIEYKRGQNVQVKVIQFGPLGASVTVNKHNHGLILQKELALFRDRRNNEEVLLGEELTGYVERVRDNGKIDISLRPVDLSRIELVKNEVYERLKSSKDGVIHLGDKSSPYEISLEFPGYSKKDYKIAIGSLYKEGLIVPTPYSITIVSQENLHISQEAALTAYKEKKKLNYKERNQLKEEDHKDNNKEENEIIQTKERIESNQDATIFIGNLAPTTDIVNLKTAIYQVILPSNIKRIYLCKDEYNICKGYGYIELQHTDLVDQSIKILKNYIIKNRKLRVDYADKEKRFRLAAKTSWKHDLYYNNTDYQISNLKNLKNLTSSQRRKLKLLQDSGNNNTDHDDEYNSNNSNNIDINHDTNMILYNKKHNNTTATIWSEYNSENEYKNSTEISIGGTKFTTVPHGRSRLNPLQPIPAVTLFIGGLAYEINEIILKKELSQYVNSDELASVRVIYDNQTGESRGFAFVDVFTVQSAEKVSVCMIVGMCIQHMYIYVVCRVYVVVYLCMVHCSVYYTILYCVYV